MKKQNYYLRIVKRQQKIRRDKLFRDWFKKEKLTGRQITRAASALAKGRSSF